MGSTNKTTNYDLSQFVGSDKPSWLGDYNADMGKIDLAIKARAVEAGQAQASADTANGKADALDTRMDTAEDNILALQNASTTDHAQIATNTGNISKNAQDIVQLDAKIGHTQITIGDHTVTGAIAELAARPVTGDADDISYDNTTSGLTATNVQDAIDELAARPTVADASDVTFDNTGTTIQATNVEDAIKEVASSPASNVRWNSTTDRFEVLKNGSWVQSIRAFVNSIAVWVAGVFGIEVDNGVYTYSNTFTNGAFTINDTELLPAFTDVNQSRTLVSHDLIDFSMYTSIKVTVGGVVQTLSVSDVNTSGYFVLVMTQESNAINIDFGAVPAKENVILHNAITRKNWVKVGTTSAPPITEITIE